MAKIKLINALALFTCCISAAIQSRWNALLAEIINRVASGGQVPGAMLAYALAVMLVMGLTGYGKGYVTGCACETVSHELRMGYARFHAALDAAEAERLNAGEQLSALQNEIGAVSGYINNSLFQLISDAVNFVFTFVFLLTVNARLTLAANLPAFLAVAYVLWSSRVIVKATDKSQQARAEMNRHGDTLVTLFPVIKLFEAERLTAGLYVEAAAGWRTQTTRLERTKARLMSLSAVLSNVPLLLLFLVGGGMALQGVITVGTLYIFLNLSGNVSGVLMNMPGHMAAFRQFAANLARLRPKILWV
jgi:ABC-type multidrug transport system fused ATPase/permease subunit